MSIGPRDYGDPARGKRGRWHAAAGAQLGRLLEPDGVGTLAHSTVVLRARELDRWAQSEQLQSLLDGGERYVRSARFISAWT